MKHAIIAACGAVTVAGTIALSAQTPPTPARPQTPQPSQSTPSRTDDRTTTLTGCLKAWDATMSGPSAGAVTPGATAGSTPAAPGGKFVLTNVRPDSGGTAASGSATTSAPTTMPSAGNGDTKQYVLTADSGVNLAAHNNHQVRVTGKVEAMADHSAMDNAKPGATARPGEMTPGSSAGATTDQTRTSTDRNNMGKAWPTMTVSSVTMISATCTNPTN